MISSIHQPFSSLVYKKRQQVYANTLLSVCALPQQRITYFSCSIKYSICSRRKVDDRFFPGLPITFKEIKRSQFQFLPNRLCELDKILPWTVLLMSLLSSKSCKGAPRIDGSKTLEGKVDGGVGLLIKKNISTKKRKINGRR